MVIMPDHFKEFTSTNIFLTYSLFPALLRRDVTISNVSIRVQKLLDPLLGSYVTSSVRQSVTKVLILPVISFLFLDFLHQATL